MLGIDRRIRESYRWSIRFNAPPFLRKRTLSSTPSDSKLSHIARRIGVQPRMF